MKKVLFTSIILILSIQSIGQNFSAGVLAGVNASQIRGDSYSGFNKGGLLVGIYSDFTFSKDFSFQFELNYSQKGSRKNQDLENGDVDFFLLRMNYIEVPVMLRWKKGNFTYEGGVYLGQFLDYHLEDENGVTTLEPEWNQFSNQDFGGLIGLNYNFTKHLIMNWRYNHSILSFREFDSDANFWFNDGMFHQYLSFSLRYEFFGTNE